MIQKLFLVGLYSGWGGGVGGGAYIRGGGGGGHYQLYYVKWGCKKKITFVKRKINITAIRPYLRKT